MNKLEEARRLRPLIEKAVVSGLDDSDAMEAVTLFPAWSGSGVQYYAQGGSEPQSKVRYEGELFKCVQSHASQAAWNPKDAASLWARMDDPAIEFPAWRQPTGAQDAYHAGDKVSHNGKHWVSIGDGNVWEPGVYGWDAV